MNTRIQTDHSKYIYQNGLDKACFHRDMAYVVYKGLGGRTVSNKLLYDKAFEIASNPG